MHMCVCLIIRSALVFQNKLGYQGLNIYVLISVATGLQTDKFGFRTRTDTCFKKKSD